VLTPSTWAVTSDSQSWVYGFQGGRLDPLTNKINFRHRDLDTGTDTWMEKDGGYWDGADLYRFESSSPINSIDPFGRMTWTTEPTRWIVQSPLNLPILPQPDGINWGGGLPVSPNTLAATLPRLSLTATAAGFCIFSHLKDTHIDFKIDFYLLPDRELHRLGVDPAWVRRAEQDHVNDDVNWANNTGKPIAIRWENEGKKLTFPNNKACLEWAHDNIFLSLKDSLETASRASVAAHDTSHEHTWGDPNQRP
jgi:RHS repeat-associated protein